MESITVKSSINSPVSKVWEMWTSPEHIVKWNSPSPDWHTPHAQNELQAGGNFLFRMEATDGSNGFDFEGTYDEIVKYRLISYTLEDGRKAHVSFTESKGKTEITETFDGEQINSKDMQKAGWQAILNNFKTYTENNGQ